MTPERWQLVKPIFFHASELEGDAQRRYVDEACGNDAELKREVDSLLAVSLNEGAVLDRPVSQFVSLDDIDSIDSSLVGQRLGAYQLVECLGRGGMGEVYRAHRVDSGFEMQVAIKLVRAGSGSDLLRRFKAERQILASLDHPGIARMLDGGVTPTGEPYLVLELVTGEPIDAYCEKRDLSIEERLLLFRQVCAAVTYAHQRLVVHRDLKPANILVTPQGAVKLLDFGIAKLLTADSPDGDRVEATRTAVRAMTPQYCSPEQILGLPITTASDVYSLGVVLFHMLTGDSPYRNAIVSTRDAIRDVCETEPLSPSAAASKSVADGKKRPLLDRDLDHITLRALRKEPEERYGSAEQFSEDIRRYLAGLPVLASGDQLAYRVRKFWGRHWLELAAAGVVTLALVAGTIVALHQARIADLERARAERHFASVRKLADTFMFQVHDAIKDLQGSTQARELLVDTALEYLNTLAKEASGDQGLQLDVAIAYGKVGDIQGKAYDANIGKPRAALDSYGKAIAILEPLIAADPQNRQARSTLASMYMRRSRLLMLAGNGKEAAENSLAGVKLYEALVAERPDADMRNALSKAYTEHSSSLDLGGVPDTDVSAFAQKGIDILEALNREQPNDASLQHDLATAYSGLATNIQGGELQPELVERALELHRKALAIDDRLFQSAAGPRTAYIRTLMADYADISTLLYEKADYRGAADNARAAYELLPQLEADKGNAQVEADAVQARWQFAHALVAVDADEEAARVLETNISALHALIAKNENIVFVYLLGACEQSMGTLHARRGEAAHADRAMRLKEFRAAASLYDQAMARINRVAAVATLDRVDKIPLDEAKSGAARVKAELASLQ
jgi:hypothetical protein